jgi:hypothetical protein
MQPQTAIGNIDATILRAYKIIAKNKINSPLNKVNLFLLMLDNTYEKLAQVK